MKQKSILINQLTPGTVFLVDGISSFSRIYKRIEGEELQRENDRRRMRGWLPQEKPYTSFTIHNAKVRIANPAAKRPEEIYAEESLYHSIANPNKGLFYTGINKGSNLPWLGERRNNEIIQIHPERELDENLNVTLVMRVFKGKINNGISLEGVIVNEPIRYYNNNVTSQLEQFGLTFKPTTAPTKQEEKPVEANISFDEDIPSNENNTFSDFNPSQNSGYQAPYNDPYAQYGIVYNPNHNRNY